MASGLFSRVDLEDVFTPGGQPVVTYVGRDHLGVESSVKKALAQKSIIVSLTGTTKSGKTVLCRNVLEDYEFVWIEGGQVKTEIDFWNKVCSELEVPAEVKRKEGLTRSGTLQIGGSAETGIPANKAGITITAGGSRLKVSDEDRTYKIDSMLAAIEYLTANKICLVIDDFHYVPDEDRASLIRSLKGAVFQGLKVILLSTPHRAFEAIKAEAEVTGRFKHVTVPTWSTDDLSKIASSGFSALNCECPKEIVDSFCLESQGSPLLMQQFCWNLCYDNGILTKKLFKSYVPSLADTHAIFNEVAQDAGLPIYEKLAKGPQSRTDRIPRPLINGQTADIYQAILLAVAVTGPQEKLSYDQIRTSLNNILTDKIPQKLEVSNTLNHLSAIDAKENRGDRAIDWDVERLDLVITDPFFRFFLRWKIAPLIKTIAR